MVCVLGWQDLQQHGRWICCDVSSGHWFRWSSGGAHSAAAGMPWAACSPCSLPDMIPSMPSSDQEGRTSRLRAFLSPDVPSIIPPLNCSQEPSLSL